MYPIDFLPIFENGSAILDFIAMNFFGKPYNILVPMMIALLVFSLFTMNTVVDIHLHDTFIVLSWSYIFWLFTICLLVIFLLYKATYKILYSRFLSWMHIIATILTIAAFLLSDIWIYDAGHTFFTSPLSNKTVEQWVYLSKVLEATLLAVIATQFIYLINLIIGIIKKYFAAS